PPPPWPRPAGMAQRVAAAGLHEGSMEGMKLHIHQHLDVYYNGQHVTVPALIGIGDNGSFFAELHTHTTSGTLHVESQVIKDFRLGQFFIEWGVPLKGATVYDNGVRVPHPEQLILRDKQEIAILYGRPPAKIPSVYPGYSL
ncbi:MAG: hypothetical protein KGR26_10340, partial [Cyanobacteria bacterium REEB65]|nr:hypothetical protein [Cyanobacteria bacterium REEB65]